MAGRHGGWLGGARSSEFDSSDRLARGGGGARGQPVHHSSSGTAAQGGQVIVLAGVRILLVGLRGGPCPHVDNDLFGSDLLLGWRCEGPWGHGQFVLRLNTVVFSSLRSYDY